MAKLTLVRDLNTCRQANDITFFVGESRTRIDEVVARLNDANTRAAALRELETLREELASVAKLWASAQILNRIQLTDSDRKQRLARPALGLWLKELPSVAFPNISKKTCRLLEIPRAVRQEAVMSREVLEGRTKIKVVHQTNGQHYQATAA